MHKTPHFSMYKKFHFTMFPDNVSEQLRNELYAIQTLQ